VKCIVGLGNPGSRYRFTRHNIGFLALELMITSFKASHVESNELFECYQASVVDSPVTFLMPQTYMNNSGVAVREIRQRYDLVLENILVLFDDFQLPFGTLRLRPKGSDGGHNGIASIIYHLQSDLVPRLRIGVGGVTLPSNHTHDVMADYVLSPFDAGERELLPRLLNHTQDACVSWMETGIQKTMSQYNRNFFSSAGAE